MYHEIFQAIVMIHQGQTLADTVGSKTVVDCKHPYVSQIKVLIRTIYHYMTLKYFLIDKTQTLKGIHPTNKQIKCDTQNNKSAR